MSKYVFTGLESQGKSLKLAMLAEEVLERNYQWYLKSGFKRPICSNMKFSKAFELKAQGYGLPIVYWRHLDELIQYEDCDVFIDEAGNYFDSRNWENLSLDIRRWLTQGAKCGIEMYCSAQDFSQIDKAFRRLVKELYFIRKLIGSPRPSPRKPPVTSIWGLCMVTQLVPQPYNEDKPVKMSLIPSFFFIKKEACGIFDTNQKIVQSNPPNLKKVVRVCLEDGYRQVRYH